MNTGALLEDLRSKGVALEVCGLTLRVAAPEDVATEELHETVSRHKHALIRLLERERKRLEEADRLGLLIKWSKEPGYVASTTPPQESGTTYSASDARPPSSSPPKLVANDAGRDDVRRGGSSHALCTWNSERSRLKVLVEDGLSRAGGILDYGIVVDGLHSLFRGVRE